MLGEETKYWKFHHLGLIVADATKTVGYYSSLGFVEILSNSPTSNNPPPWVELTAYGEDIMKEGKLLIDVKPGSKSVPITWCRIGTLLLEIIQPVSAWKNVSSDFLKKYGDGISHLAYTIDRDHFEEEVEKMKARGLDIVLSGKRAGGGGYYYFDTRKYGGIVTELMWYPYLP